MACSDSAINDEITRLESVLNTAATFVQTDGESVRYDLQEVRRRLSELYQQSGAICPNGQAVSKPRLTRGVFGHDY